MAVLCACVLAALAVFFVRTDTGQRIDDAALKGQVVVEHRRTAETSDRILRTISVGSLMAFGGSLAAVALVRGRWHLALGVIALIGGANVTTEVLKKLLERPDLLHNGVIDVNTLPSGHSTVAASLAAAFVVVVPVRLRPLAATIGAGYAAGIATMTLAAGWHRPSDAVAAFAVVGIWTFGVCAVLVATRGTGSPRVRERLPGLLVGAILVVGGGFAAVIASTTVSDTSGIHFVRIGAAYVVSALTVVVVGAGFVFAEVLLLRGVSLDSTRRAGRWT